MLVSEKITFINAAAPVDAIVLGLGRILEARALSPPSLKEVSQSCQGQDQVFMVHMLLLRGPRHQEVRYFPGICEAAGGKAATPLLLVFASTGVLCFYNLSSNLLLTLS